VAIAGEDGCQSEGFICQEEGLLTGLEEQTTPVLSLIVPAFNEGVQIRMNLEESVEVLRTFGVPFEVVVVNDGSHDDTRKHIDSAARDFPEIVYVTYRKNSGKGNALTEGVRFAMGNLVAFMDADLEIHPRQLVRFMEEMEGNGADVVIGSKRHPGSKVDYPLKRRFLSWGFSLLVRSLFGLKLSDTQPGFKLFKKEVLERELPKLVVKKYAFDLELLVNADQDGFRIVEVPIELHFNRKEGGRIGFGEAKDIFLDTLGIFYRLRIIRYYEREGSLIGGQHTHTTPVV